MKTIRETDDSIIDQFLGKTVFIRTVTMIYVGTVRAIDDEGILLDSAAWVAETGRFGKAVSEGSLEEVEPYPGSVMVMRGPITDMLKWPFLVPTEAMPA